jgi:hypothetical protein
MAALFEDFIPLSSKLHGRWSAICFKTRTGTLQTIQKLNAQPFYGNAAVGGGKIGFKMKHFKQVSLTVMFIN